MIARSRLERYDIYDDHMRPDSRPLMVSDLVFGAVSTSHLYEHSTAMCDGWAALAMSRDLFFVNPE